MGLLKGHEWDYLQHTAVKKTEAVCWPDGWMIHPDRERLFVVRKNAGFVLQPTKIEEAEFSSGSWSETRHVYLWKRSETMLEKLYKVFT